MAFTHKKVLVTQRATWYLDIYPWPDLLGYDVKLVDSLHSMPVHFTIAAQLLFFAMHVRYGNIVSIVQLRRLWTSTAIYDHSTSSAVAGLFACD